MTTDTKRETKAQMEARLAEERRIEAEADEARRKEAGVDADGVLVAADVPELDDELAQRRGGKPEPELTQQESDEAFAAEMERHGLAMMALFGDDARLFEPCPTCQASGFAFRDRDKPPEFVHHPRTRICMDCNGLGQMETGSKAQGQTQLACPTCNGQGYTFPPELSGVPFASEQAGGTAPPALVAPAAAQVADAWGRPPGHAHYGMHPAMVTA